MWKEKTKTCKNCHACRLLFTIYWFDISVILKHYCIRHKRLTELSDVCEDWQKKRVEYDLSKERFDAAEENIKYILEHIPED